MTVDIDPGAGFCPGVVRAISKAEAVLENEDAVFCLGEIVHNPQEVKRLRNKGVLMIHHKDLPSSGNVLIRAHGEPPETYRVLRQHENISLIEGTCPVVMRLQQRIRKAHTEMKPLHGQVVIFGKKDHPEVIGLQGFASNQAIVVSDEQDVVRINPRAPVRFFSQTTMDPGDYQRMENRIREHLQDDIGKNLVVYDSICKVVRNRVEDLRRFAAGHDVIIFVSGKNSSNGRYLYSVSKNVNPRTYLVESPGALTATHTKNARSIGISGATSTPQWLLEEMAEKIKSS